MDRCKMKWTYDQIIIKINGAYWNADAILDQTILGEKQSQLNDKSYKKTSKNFKIVSTEGKKETQ